MLSKMWKCFKQAKSWVIEQVLWAEKDLKGKTGPEKRKAVIERLDKLIVLPWYLEWFDDALIGWLVDNVCEELNWMSDHDFGGVELTKEETETLVAALTEPVSAIPYNANESVKECLDEMASAGNRAPDEEAATDTIYPEPKVAESETDHTPWQIPVWTPERQIHLRQYLTDSEKQQRESNFQRSIDFALKWVDKKNFTVVNGEPVLKDASTEVVRDDSHGAMAWGISIPTLKAAFASGLVQHWNIGRLTKGEAKEIYRKYAWDRYGWGEIDWPACLCCLDLSINHSGFAWILQRAANDCGQSVTINGKYGPKTFAALRACNPTDLASAIIKRCWDYHGKIAKVNNPIKRLYAMAKAAGISTNDKQ